ncbi:MAG TPA: L-threonylcarbamoyladenylate synthase [Methylomirabilota bacterium]|nr:L-threonylcarbamoyladenylate synthase [Methylomirabilota bacterium]
MVAVDAARPEAAVLAEAVGVLRAGGLVAFPTETFYGLGAAALQPAAARRVYDAKGRPTGKPVLVLVDSVEMAAALAETVSPAASALMARHWPGALTLVLRAGRRVPAEVTAGTGTVGVRLSSHPVARGLVTALGEPVTAPSANPSGGAPPVTAAAVLEGLAGRIDLVLDAGPTAGGAPSTVVDATVDPPRIVRAGAVRL